ncbi:MAG TPA: hypothetical protein V6D22_08565 [Candidatus Obscuribacterales bacterium]
MISGKTNLRRLVTCVLMYIALGLSMSALAKGSTGGSTGSTGSTGGGTGSTGGATGGGGHRHLFLRPAVPTAQPAATAFTASPPPIIFVSPPANAVLPTDQNFGKTGITLIDQFADRNFAKNRDLFHKRDKTAGEVMYSVTGSRVGGDEQSKPLMFKRGALCPPANAVIINTADSTSGEHLLPIAYTEGTASVTRNGASTQSHPPIVIHVSAARSNLVLFNKDNQLSLGDMANNDQTLFSGSSGTAFSANNGIVYLHVGRLLIDSGSETVKVATKAAGLKVEPGSAALFEYWPGQPIRVVALAGANPSPVKVRVSFRTGEPIELQPGQELVISDQHTVETSTIALDKLDRQLTLVADQTQQLSPAEKTAYDRLLAHLASGAKKSTSDLSPTSSTDSRTKGWIAEPLRIFAADGSELMTDEDGRVTLYSGNIFLRTAGPAVIQTEFAAIRIEDAAVVAAQYSSGTLRVDTCDGPHAVWVVTGHYRIPLNPGTELLLTDHKPQQSEAYAADGIGRRRVTAAGLDNGLTVALADFSIFSMLKNMPYLRPLKRPATAVDARLVDGLLGEAATLNAITSARGEFFAQTAP